MRPFTSMRTDTLNLRSASNKRSSVLNAKPPVASQNASGISAATSRDGCVSEGPPPRKLFSLSLFYVCCTHRSKSAWAIPLVARFFDKCLLPDCARTSRSLEASQLPRPPTIVTICPLLVPKPLQPSSRCGSTPLSPDWFVHVPPPSTCFQRTGARPLQPVRRAHVNALTRNQEWKARVERSNDNVLGGWHNDLLLIWVSGCGFHSSPSEPFRPTLTRSLSLTTI